MKTKARDRELIEVMRRYFGAKAERAELRALLEQARRATGEDIGRFYDPRTNAAYAEAILRCHALNGEMRALMDRAQDWARQEAGALESEPGTQHQDASSVRPDAAAGDRQA